MAHEDQPFDPGKLLDPGRNVFSLGEWHAFTTGLTVGFGAGWLGGFLVVLIGASVLSEEPAYAGAGFALGAIFGSLVGVVTGRLI